MKDYKVGDYIIVWKVSHRTDESLGETFEEKAQVVELGSNPTIMKVKMLNTYNVGGTNVVTWTSVYGTTLDVEKMTEVRNKSIDSLLQ